MRFPDPQWNDAAFDVKGVLARLDAGSRVADCGCFGWTLAAACAARGHRLTGLDREEPPGRPADTDFARMDGSLLHLPDDSADLVVANHVLEHLAGPMDFFREAVRVAAPGGLLWIESPSELSAQGQSSDDPSDHAFHSFWDDPTHVRPWTPGALYRMALSFRCLPLRVSRGVAGHIPVSRMLARKPRDVRGAPPYTFVSLKDVAPGLDAAWRAIWPDAADPT